MHSVSFFFSLSPLEKDTDQQRPRAVEQGDPEENQRRRKFPGQRSCIDACGGQTSICALTPVGDKTIHEYRVPGTGMEPLLEREIESAI